MRKLFLSLTFFIGLFTINAQNGYDITINLKNGKDKEVYLAYYQFDKTYLADTCKNVVNGKIRFKGRKNLDKGVYCLISQEKKLYFDFLVDGKIQKIQIDTDADKLVENLKTIGENENSNFFNYLKFISSKNKEFEGFVSQTKGMNKKDSTDFMTTKRKSLDESVAKYDSEFLVKHKGTYVGDVINLKSEKIAKDIPLASNKRPDSLYAYRYYKKHYWDGVNFEDDGIVRVPFFATKLKNYFENAVVKHPDSVIVEIDRMMKKTKAGTKMNQHLLAYFTSTYENYKLMGFDKVFVYMVDEYFRTGKAKGIYDDNTIKNVIRRGGVLKPLLLDSKAPELYMIDLVGHEKLAPLGFDNVKTSEEMTRLYNNNIDLLSSLYVTLHNLKAEYTVLVFWDVDCSHCKVEIPKLKKVYDELKAQGKDVKVFAVYTEFEIEKYKKYLTENNLSEWLNVYDGAHINNLKEKYDIYSTPVIYVLDKDKKIKAKRVGVEQVKEIIDQMEKDKKNSKK